MQTRRCITQFAMTLAREESFPQLAPIAQFQRLLDGAAAASKAKAALLSQSLPAAQSCLPDNLAMMEPQSPLPPSEELGYIRKQMFDEPRTGRSKRRPIRGESGAKPRGIVGPAGASA